MLILRSVPALNLLRKAGDSTVVPDTLARGDDRALSVGGISIPVLAEQYGTPLYLLDVETIVNRAKTWMAQVSPHGTVYYAGKAFLCTAMVELMDRLGVGVDVVSGGELATALGAGMSPQRLLFHGNVKTAAELAAAVSAPGLRVVVDSLEELRALSAAAVRCPDNGPIAVLIRVTPGIEPDTHDYIKTGHDGSKFGFPIGEVAHAAVAEALASPHIALAGYHAHIGSQVLDPAPMAETARRLMRFAVEVWQQQGFWPQMVDVGGGVGVAYQPGADAPDIAQVVQAVVAEATPPSLDRPRVAFEPGRSIVADSGLTVYRVEVVKQTPGGPTYCAVDGGMGDNIRPALYGAPYTADVAGPPRPGRATVTLAGRYCETGDLIIRDAVLPPVAVGDLVVVYTTGAYTHSMASHYNRVPRPPVVAVWRGEAHLWVRGETFADVRRQDVPLAWAL